MVLVQVYWLLILNLDRILIHHQHRHPYQSLEHMLTHRSNIRVDISEMSYRGLLDIRLKSPDIDQKR